MSAKARVHVRYGLWELPPRRSRVRADGAPKTKDVHRRYNVMRRATAFALPESKQTSRCGDAARGACPHMRSVLPVAHYMPPWQIEHAHPTPTQFRVKPNRMAP
eukprot:7379766-Prymnesium_polylepis.2